MIFAIEKIKQLSLALTIKVHAHSAERDPCIALTWIVQVQELTKIKEFEPGQTTKAKVLVMVLNCSYIVVAITIARNCRKMQLMQPQLLLQFNCWLQFKTTLSTMYHWNEFNHSIYRLQLKAWIYTANQSIAKRKTISIS